MSKILNRRQEFDLLLDNVIKFRNYINDNSITEFTVLSDLSVGAARKLAIWLGDSGSIKTLEIGVGGTMSAEVAQIVFQALATNTTITYLILTYAKIGDLAALTDLLRENKSLQKIRFKYTILGSFGLKAIAEGLTTNRTLRKLDLFNCSITHAANQTRDLSGLQLLLANLHVNELYINGSDIEQDGADIIGSWLSTNPPLQVLAVNHGLITNINSIATGLQTNYNLYELNLDNNNLSDSTFNVLAQTLQANDTLRYLDLSNNNIDDDQASLIVESGKYLKKLDLSANNITDRAAITFAAVLSKNDTMTDLYLISNKIGDEGAEQLAEMLTVNTSLSNLNLYANQISDVGAEILYEAIKYNPTIELTLDENNIHDEDLLDLIEEKNKVNEHNKKVNSLTLVQILRNYKK